MTKLVRVSTAFFVAVLLAGPAWAAESVRVTADRVNLRSGPGTDSRIVVKVDKGTQLEVLGREGSWVRVAAPGTGAAAYISASLCEPVAAAPSPQPTTSEPAAAPASYAPSSGESALQFGLQADWASDGVDFGLGARVAAEIGAVPNLGALLTLDYFFGSGGSLTVPEAAVDVSGHGLEIGLNATYSFELQGLEAYAGGGLSHFRASSETTSGEPPVTLSASGSSTSLGLVAGAKFKERFFGEARYRFGDAGHLTVSAGILFDSPW